ncbi:MAG: MltA domain-containing protein [Alphaproteobacteria bacterium]
MADPLTAYFIHIQGSARLRLTDGTVMRVAYAAKTGHAYTSIGRRAIAQGFLHPDRCGKAELEAWISANPGPGRALMQANQSFIFFRQVEDLAADAGPIGAAGVDLTDGVSLAVDRHWTTFHTPVWVTADHVPTDKMLNQAVDQTTAQTEDKSHFARLMIAQDTGSAIVGPARGDLERCGRPAR